MSKIVKIRPDSFFEARRWWGAVEGYGLLQLLQQRPITIPKDSILQVTPVRQGAWIYFKRDRFVSQVWVREVPKGLDSTELPHDATFRPGFWATLKDYLPYSISTSFLLGVGLAFWGWSWALKAHLYRSPAMFWASCWLAVAFAAVVVPMGHWLLTRKKAQLWAVRRSAAVEAACVVSVGVYLLMVLGAEVLNHSLTYIPR